MTDEPVPQPVFPQYSPPVAPGIMLPDAKQQKPLMKLINRRLHPPKRVAKPQQKKLARKRKKDEGWS